MSSSASIADQAARSSTDLGADHTHDGDLGLLGIADLLAEALGSGVHLDADARRGQLVLEAPCEVHGLLKKTDRQTHEGGGHPILSTVNGLCQGAGGASAPCR